MCATRVAQRVFGARAAVVQTFFEGSERSNKYGRERDDRFCWTFFGWLRDGRLSFGRFLANSIDSSSTAGSGTRARAIL